MTHLPRIEPIGDDALGNTSYVVDVGHGCAVVVDPRRDVDEYLQAAARAGLRIVGTFETHLHADFVGGTMELARATRAAIYAAADSELRFPHVPVSAGSEIHIGASSIEVLATPGHTPEHLAFLLRMNGQHVLFSGGSLIVGGAARTDLSGADRTDALSRAQFASLRRLAELGDDTLLCPTHGAGSFCSTGSARARTSTIGAERAQNPLLAIDDERAFVERLLAAFGSYPRYFAYLREVNRAGAPVLSTLPPVRQIAAQAAQDAVERGAVLIDGRAWTDWARAHPSGSISIEVRPAFASWLGWVAPFGAPVVLVLDPGQVDEAVRLARRIGYDGVEGWLRFEAWRAAGLPETSIETVGPEETVDRAAHGALVLDVRQRDEYMSSRIAGAAHLELGDIIAGKTPDASEVVTYCGHGERSATAAGLLARRGVRVANLLGGTAAWRRSGLAFE